MAESTTTLQSLRRSVARQLRMPFIMRVGDSSIVDSGTGTTVVDAALVQTITDFWKGHWYYRISDQVYSLITAFNTSTDTLTTEKTYSPVHAAADVFEIHSVWNAGEIHAAINRAIDTVKKVFPITGTDESLVIREKYLNYSLSGISNLWKVQKVWVEYRDNSVTGSVVSATNGAAVLDAAMPSDVDTNWKITIYAGTGAGQIRNISSGAGTTTCSVSINWTTNPDSTSKYRIFDASEERITWRPFTDYRLDNAEFPDTMYVNSDYSLYHGLRFRIEYLSLQAALSAEADTTIIPAEYLINKTCSILHGALIASTKADRDLHYAEFKRYDEMANEYLARYAPHSSGTLINQALESGSYFESNDPLNWRVG